MGVKSNDDGLVDFEGLDDFAFDDLLDWAGVEECDDMAAMVIALWNQTFVQVRRRMVEYIE